MSSLVIGDFIGAGGYGSVYHGHWEGRAVAIKTFHITRQEALYTAGAAALQHEIQMLEQLRDKHVIQFYGTTFDDHDMLVLAMEYAEGGSLHRAIERRRLLLNDWPTKIRIAQEMVRGLNYIHHKHIVHRDLKSLNVLLTRHLEVKLCDFGLATVKIQSATKASSSFSSSSALNHDSHNSNSSGSALKGTLRWMAPELFGKRPQYSTKSDMYALGMVMWEMAANCTMPFRHQLDNAVVVTMVKGGEREDLPDDTPAMYRLCVQRCWDPDPSNRPEACELVTEDEKQAASRDDNVSEASFLSLSLVDDDDLLQSAPHSLYTHDTVVEEGGQLELDEQQQQQQQQADPPPPPPLPPPTEQDEAESAWALATMYEQNDPTQAFYWYHQAAEHGHAEAQFITGERLYHGQGTPVNYSKAAAWYRQAAKKGHAEAQYRLGCMLQDGDLEGLQQDYQEAAKWHRRAAEQGHRPARKSLARLYEKGHGLPRDLQKAVYWYREAAAGHGDPEVQELLRKLVQPIKKKPWKKLLR